MVRIWKRAPRTLQWVVACSGLIVLLVGGSWGYLSYRLHHLSLAEIEKRHALSPVSSDEGGGVPSFLTGSVDKANAFANKPIQPQDALDVAAILFQSGLSLQQIAYLTGKADVHLSTEEKQHIRDLLLSKLTLDEITALRSITSQYGKGLLILDPNYPIELVGVYDEAERARIQKELDARKSGAAGNLPEASPQVASAATPLALTPTPSSHNSTLGAVQSTPMPISTSTPSGGTPNPPQSPSGVPSGALAESSTATPIPNGGSTNSSAKLNELLAPYQKSLDQLQLSCQANANQLLTQIEQALNEAQGKPDAQTAVETRFLTEVTQAEQGCDAKFQALLSEAQQTLEKNGQDLAILDSWRQTYDNRKQALRLQAIQELSAELKASPIP